MRIESIIVECRGFRGRLQRLELGEGGFFYEVEILLPDAQARFATVRLCGVAARELEFTVGEA